MEQNMWLRTLMVLVGSITIVMTSEGAAEIISLSDGRRLVGVYDESTNVVHLSDRNEAVRVRFDEIAWRAPAVQPPDQRAKVSEDKTPSVTPAAPARSSEAPKPKP
jgi:hypothetical protein